MKELIKARAYSLGFCLCGVSSPAPFAEFEKYRTWVELGYQGSMTYLASQHHCETRRDPRLLVPWVKSILVLAWPYLLNPVNAEMQAGWVSGYVGTEDYHDFLPQKIAALVQEINSLRGCEINVKTFTDSAPLLERELASRAGLGWIGKNSCLISPQKGSSFLLAELFVDFDLEPDAPFSSDHCGTCQRCIQACPTKCILPDRTIDASRCISALTIENKGLLDEPFSTLIGHHLFGCDICQSVCPWNQHENLALIPRSYSAEEMVAMLDQDETAFKNRFQHQAILRAKHRGWVRNLCAVLANLGIFQAVPTLERLFATSSDELVQESAKSALTKIESKKQ